MGLVPFIAGQFIAVPFIARSIHRKVDSSQDQFVTGSIHRRFMSTENLIETWNFLSKHTKLGSFCCKDSFGTAGRHWKTIFTEIYLIEMCNFWSEYENWVHFVVKSFASLPGATEKLVLLNCGQTGSPKYRPAINQNRAAMTKRTQFCMFNQVFQLT
jgi:hypothetical protein